jgi:hypothetical protein
MKQVLSELVDRLKRLEEKVAQKLDGLGKEEYSLMSFSVNERNDC